ncbi:DUF5309 family protein [Alkalihalobacillus sp. NPDC078783]|uniref:SU10 major capsid protein n=1 Tax=Streptomyces albidoflavus TaxID=1886 RepID=UPI0033D175AB
MSFLSTQDYTTHQNIDMHQQIIDLNPERTKFLNFLLTKQEKATSPKVYWIEEELSDAAETIAEGGDAPDFVKDSPKEIDNHLEIFSATASVSTTRQESVGVGIQDEMAREVAKKASSIKRLAEKKLLYGNKRFAQGKRETNGIFNQVDPTHQFTGQLTAETFDQTLLALYEAGVNYNMQVFCSAHVKNIIDKFDESKVRHLTADKMYGYTIDRYSTAYGDVTFVDVPGMNRDDLLVLNDEFVTLPVLYGLKGSYLGKKGSLDSFFMETQMGVKLLNRKAAATFKIEAPATGE